MHRLIRLSGLCLLGLWISTAQAIEFRANYNRDSGYEYKTFFGVDVIDLETDLDYDNGSETYEYTGVRLRYGIESAEGASAGIEFIPVLSDDTIDPFGDEFELEIGPSLGAYFTVGKPIYFRLGLSVADTEYTAVEADVSDDDLLTAIDYGLGFNYSPSPQMTIYGEYSIRDGGDLEYDTFFSDEIDHDSEMISIGLNYIF